MDNTNKESPSVSDTSMSGRRLLSRYKWVAIVIGILIIVGAVFVFNRLQANKNKTQSPKADPNMPLPLITPKAPADDYGKIILEADLLYTKADYDGAIKRLNGLISKTTDKAQLYGLYTRLGRSYKAKSDWRNAITALEKAQQTGQPGSGGLYPEIAESAEKAGDKAKAIEAYKKAIDEIKGNNSPVAKRIIDTYQAKIKSLGGS